MTGINERKIAAKFLLAPELFLAAQDLVAAEVLLALEVAPVVSVAIVPVTVVPVVGDGEGACEGRRMGESGGGGGLGCAEETGGEGC